jgi:hypothetical protein
VFRTQANGTALSPIRLSTRMDGAPARFCSDLN